MLRCMGVLMAGLALFLLAGVAGCSDSNANPQTTWVHFFVAPKLMPDHSPAEEHLAALRVWLAQQAGGYTELPDAPGGWLGDQGQLKTEDQVAFLVTADSNLKPIIGQYLIDHFGQSQPYVVVWETLS